MIFYQNLYVGESIRDVEEVKQKLLNNRWQRSVYVIAISSSEDQLDIFDSILLKQRFYDGERLKVVGLAGSQEEAVQLVCSMMEEVAAADGGADLKGYLLADFKDE